jgi:autotransporter-associated beta strand protein
MKLYIFIVFILTQFISFGAIKTWDGGGADNNWATAANWDFDAAPNPGDDLVFDGIVRTNSVNNFVANTSFNSIQFNLSCGAFVLSGNSIYLSGGTSAIISNHTSLTVSIVINITFNVAEPSITTTAGGNTDFSGTISHDGFTLSFVGNGTSTISQIISGTGALTKSGTGILTLTANNTFSGVTTISAGTLQIGNAGTTGSISSSSIVNNAALIYSRSGAFTVSTPISGTGTVTKSGTGILTLTANNNFSGVTTISAGTLQIGNAGTTGSISSSSIVNNAALIYNRSDAFTVSTPISGTGTVTKSGLGTLTISNANTYTGGFSISDGSVSASAANNFGVPSGVKLINFTGHGTLIVTASFSTSKEFTSVGVTRSMTFDIQSGVTLTANGTIRAYSGCSPTSKNGSGTLILAAQNPNLDMGFYLNAGTVDLRRSECLGNIESWDYLYAAAGTTVLITSNSSISFFGCIQVNGTGVNLIVNRTSNGGGVVHSFYRFVSNGDFTTNITAGATVTSGTAGITIRNTTTLNGNSIIDITDPGTPDFLLTFSDDINSTNLSLTIQGSGNCLISDTIKIGSGTLSKGGIGILTLNRASTFTGNKTLNAGTLILNNTQSLGTVDGTFIINGGTIDNGSGSALTLINYPQTWAGDFTFKGTNDLHLGTGLISMNADIIITVTTAAKNLTIGGIINNNTRNLTKSGAGNIVLLSQAVTIKTLTISQGSFTSTSGNLNLAGNFTNSDTFIHNNGTVIFNAGIAQTLNGNSLNDFYNVELANTSGNIASNSNINVINTLTLTSGKLSMQGYTLTMGTTVSNGTIIGGSSSCYIVAYDNNGTIGYVKHLINSAAGSSYFYPIGDNSSYVPLTFTLTSATLSNAYLKIFTKPVKIDNLNSLLTNYVNRQWNVSEFGFTSPVYTISYKYVDSDIIGSETAFLPIKKSGSTWYIPSGSTFLTGTEQGTGTLNASSNLLTWTNLTTFSLFGAAGDQAVLLPIDLLNFNGEISTSANLLTWSTLSEINNDYFTIEKTIDGILFEIVGIVNGSGNSNEFNEYQLLDNSAREVINYYKLSQTDFDGKTKSFDMIAIDNSKKGDKEYNLSQLSLLGQEVNDDYKGLIFKTLSNGEVRKIIR